MNTQISFQLFSNLGTVDTLEIIELGYSKFDEVVKKYTRFNNQSELALLNRAKKNKPHNVSKELFFLIEKMLEISKESNYVYDPTIIDFLEHYGYDKDYDFSKLDDPKLFNKVKRLAELRSSPSEISLDKKNLTVTLKDKQSLDLGSIGKGFAIDLAANEFDVFPSYIINAGGDVRAKGEKITEDDTSPWTVALTAPFKPKLKKKKIPTLGTISLKNKSIACSGGWARQVKFFHHLINPKSGLPKNNISQTYVIADDATTADAYATVLFVGGEDMIDLVKNKNLSGLITNNLGESKYINDFQEYLNSSEN